MHNDTYDFFISYDSSYQSQADKLVNELEKKSLKCFIASRDIPGGKDYAHTVIKALKKSKHVILLYSKRADRSVYVRNEINAAVSNGMNIIPVRLEDIQYSDYMQMYIGIIQWIDSFQEITDNCIRKIIEIYNEHEKNNKNSNEEADRFIEIEDKKEVYNIEVKSNYDIIKKGMTFREIIMKEIEIDFLCIPQDKFEINDELEGSADEWTSIMFYAEDVSCLLTYGKEIVGYASIYPVKDTAYEELINGKKIMRPDMVDLYAFGGEFDIYIPMIGIIPEFDVQFSYVPVIDWLINKLKEWKEKNIIAKKIGISVYSPELERIVKILGFKYKCLNPAKGKIYEIIKDEFIKNELISKKYKGLEL